MQNNTKCTICFSEERTRVGHDVPVGVADLAPVVVQTLARFFLCDF